MHLKSEMEMIQHNSIQARSSNRCSRGKPISITHSECVSITLVIQYTKRMRRIISSLASLTPTYFSTLSHITHNPWGRGVVIDHKICVLHVSTMFA